MAVGVTTASGQGSPDYYVLMDDDGRFMQFDGSSLGKTEDFNANTVVWTGTSGTTVNSIRYSFTADASTYYLEASGSSVIVNATSSLSAIHEWYYVSPENMFNVSSGENQYIYWDNNIWTLTTSSDGKKCIKAHPVTVEQKSYPTINTAKIGTTITTDPVTIDYTDSYTFTIDDLADISYTVYTFDEEEHNWYGDADHGDTAPDNAEWGVVSGLKKVWSLHGEDHERFASVNASTGVLRVTKLPSVGEVTMTLKCTITKPGTALSRVIEKTITMKPEKIDAPTITKNTTTGKFELSSSQNSGLDIYYSKGSTEPTTPEPTTAEPSVKYTEPFTIDDDVNCIKAYAVHTFGQHTVESAVSVYNFVRFTDSEISGLKPTATVTVAPLVYSLDLKVPNNMEAYIVSRVTTIDHSAILTKLEYIPAGVPVLLMDNNKKKGKTPFFLEESTDPNVVVLTPIDLEDLNGNDNTTDDITPITDAQKAGNQLHVTDKPMTVQDAQVYMYYNSEFVLTVGGTMKAGRFYLYNPSYAPPSTTTPVTNPSSGGGARLRLVIEETTGMDDVRWKKEEVRSDYWYTLDGRRLTSQPTQKGVYLNAGRKIVVK